MVKRRTRRSVVIGAIIIALSVGIVFATLSYLQHPNTNNPHGSIFRSITSTVRAGNDSYPRVFDVRIPNVTMSENFYVGVAVTGGFASFCALNYTTYFAWKFAYNLTSWSDGQNPGNTFPWASCLAQATQVSQDTLQFPVTPGTWAVVALNTTPDTLTVTFSPA